MARSALIIIFVTFATLAGCSGSSITAPTAPDAPASADAAPDAVAIDDMSAASDRALSDDLGLDVLADQMVLVDGGVDAPEIVVSNDVSDAPDAIEVGCAAGLVRCGDVCVDSTSSVMNCGSCGMNCRSLPGVDLDRVTCVRGACVLEAVCLPLRGDCDGLAATGCETDLTSPSNCGRCGVTCSGSTPLCAMLLGDAGTARTCTNGCTSMTPTRCGMACVDTASDLLHCGACGAACVAPAGGRATCTMGVCNTSCSAGMHLCDGRCVADDDPNTCGSRCAPCPSGPVGSSVVCLGGACDFVCGMGLHRCGMVCIATTSVTGCGTSCSPCPTAANADPTCDGTRCGFRCRSGFGDCDGDPSNGCEADLLTNPMACGRCDNRCVSGSNATATCTGGTCGNRCNAAFGDCDMNLSNGCESSFASPSTCSRCDNRCMPPANATATCDGTSCGFACNAGFHRCGSMCVSSASPASCGTNCTPCSPPLHATATCDGMNCDFTCDAGYTRCGGVCVDTRTNANNCGACGRTCSFAHASGVCVAGSCTLGTCATGYGNCNSDPSDGCERNLWTDNSCGSCGSSCSPGFTSCLAGTCLAVSRTCGSSFFTSRCPDGFHFCARDSTCRSDNFHCDCNPGTQAVRCDGVPCPIAGDCNSYNWWCQPVP